MEVKQIRSCRTQNEIHGGNVMKKIAILLAILISMTGLTACMRADASDTTAGDKTTIGLELDKEL